MVAVPLGGKCTPRRLSAPTLTRMSVTDPFPKYWLGAVSNPLAVDMRVPITATEYERVQIALGAIARLKPDFNFLLVGRNFRDLQSTHKFVTTIISLGRAFASPSHFELAETVMRSTVNWLTSFRLYLDHVETDLKRHFGKASSQVAAFEDATHIAFDKYVGYRFCCKLRNYLHCAHPLSRIEISETDLSRSPKAVQSVALLLDRDNLLSTFDAWGKIVGNDLIGMPKTFPLLPLAAEAMEGLGTVYEAVLDIQVDDVLAQCDCLTDALNLIDGTDVTGTPAVFRAHWNEAKRQVSNVSPRVMPREVIVALAAVAEGSMRRSDLIALPPEQEQLSLDPTTVRQRFHRDSRGVEILSLWLNEKGATPAFSAAINRIIAEDQSIDPLISGLIYCSVVFAHMASSTLGATTEGLIAGLLDVYTQYDEPEDDV